MIESIKTALASWLRAEVFALVGEAMAGHDQDQADMLTEIEALKREKSHLLNDVSIMHDDVVIARRLAESLKGQVETLGNKLADANEEIKALVNDHMPSAQQVADCISAADLRKAMAGLDVAEHVKSAVQDCLDEMDLTDEIKEALEKKIDDDGEQIVLDVVEKDGFLYAVIDAIVQRLGKVRVRR